MIFITKQWFGVGHSSNGGRYFASSIKFHLVFLTISFIWPLPSINITQCSRTLNIFFVANKWILNSIMGWKTCNNLTACQLPIKFVAMAWSSIILLTVKLSSGITLHNTRVGESWGMELHTSFLNSFRPGVFDMNFHQGSVIIPHFGVVKWRNPCSALTWVEPCVA